MEERKSPARRARKPAGRKEATVKAKSAPRKKPAARAAGAAEVAAAMDQQSMIAVAAYFRAERRGFEPGYELDDWVAAEAEVGGKASPPAAPRRPARTRKSAR